MTPAAHHAAAIELLDAILNGATAAQLLTTWARRSRFAGSKDRAAVRDIVYDCLRRRRSLGYCSGQAESGRGLVTAYVAQSGDAMEAVFSGEGYAPAPLTDEERRALRAVDDAPDAVRYDYPDFLDEELRASLGEDRGRVMHAMQERAPVDLRVNLKRGTLEGAEALLGDDEIRTHRISEVPAALRVTQNARRVSNSKAYQNGYVELQDAASQAAARFAGVAPGMRVLDFCAGGGGKALALSDLSDGQAQVFAHDAAPERMRDLPVRAKRAGANITVLAPGDKRLKDGSFDLVFVDAPCSGTGAWRRTPDAKWRLTRADLERFDSLQTQILSDAYVLVKAGGTLVYATCSLLDRENRARVETFLEATPSLTFIEDFRSTPVTLGDGFFAAKLKKEK
jgi:16S rRNA (cytosine967-C5)-methyltransferase